MSAGLASLLGYDPDRVAELSPRQRRALGAVALASAPAVVLLVASAGYGAFLASDMVGLAVAMGLGAGLYLLNLLRLAVAGGGVGPQQTFGEVTTWMPRTVPLVMLALLGMFFAQPLILALLAAEQDPQVDALRSALAQMHARATLKPLLEERARAEATLAEATRRLEAAQRTLAQRERELGALGARELGGRKTLERAVADDRVALEKQRGEVGRVEAGFTQAREREARVRAEDVEPYVRYLGRSHFLLRRVQLTWERPLRPALLSAAMVLLMVLSWFASATVGRGASRAYEARRWKANRALIDAAYQQVRQLEAKELVQWPTYEGPRLELHEDPPYNTRPRQGGGLFEARHG